VYYRLGLTLERLGQDTLALQAYEQGLKVAPHDSYLNMAVGDAYTRAGELQRACCAYWRVARYSSDQAWRDRAQRKLEQWCAQGSASPCGSPE
jgi:hypothetical protein